MKLYELMETMYLEHGNIMCSLDVETDAIANRFGHTHEGQAVAWGGVNGRISDIPAYVGNYDVTWWELVEYERKQFNRFELFVTI